MSGVNVFDIKFLQAMRHGDCHVLQNNLNRLDCVIGDIAMSNRINCGTICTEISNIVEHQDIVVEESNSNDKDTQPDLSLELPLKHKSSVTLQYNSIEDIAIPLQAYIKQQTNNWNKKSTFVECHHCQNVEILQSELLTNTRLWREQLMANYVVNK
jgi:hypothetical protein